MIDFFDVNLAIDSGVCSFAGRQKGKTNLFKLLVNELMKSGVIVTIFDPSQVWSYNTPLKHKVTVTYDTILNNIPEFSMVYDISRLTRPNSRTFVNSIIAQDLEHQINLPQDLRPKRFYGFEEGQIYLNSQSVKWLEECYRLVTIGANFSMSYGVISQRMANIDVDVISRSGQIYLGQLWEENDLRKARNYLNYSRTETYEVLTHLPKGVFVYIKDGKKRIISVPLFHGSNANELIPQKVSVVQTIKNLIRL